MKIYWTMHSVPELDGLERREKARRFVDIQKQGRALIGRKPWLHFGIATVVVAVVVAPLGVVVDLPSILRGAILGGSVGVAYVILVQSPAIDAGRAWYRDQQMMPSPDRPDLDRG